MVGGRREVVDVVYESGCTDGQVAYLKRRVGGITIGRGCSREKKIYQNPTTHPCGMRRARWSLESGREK